MKLIFDNGIECEYFPCIKRGGNEYPVRMDKENARLAEDNSFSVQEKLERVEGCIESELTLVAQKPLVLTAAAHCVQGICFDEEGISGRLSDGSILVHYCINRWQGEGQWRTRTPAELGVYACTRHEGERSFWRLDSVSSWSTGSYYPLVMLEDKKRGVCWFFEAEIGTSWAFTLEMQGGFTARSLNMVFGGADERLAFCKRMERGESFVSERCVFGCVNGGFEEAVAALTAFKRKRSLAQNGTPLTFNDFMNCNWANESAERLLPLVARAAEVGAEVFCIDDGWQEKQGVWFAADEKFGEGGLQKLIDTIRAKGMLAGVWFEFETLPAEMAAYLGDDDVFLRRNGEAVADFRPLANFKNERLRAYLKNCVRKVYEMGVRYIKNDHNNAELVGADNGGLSPAEGIKENHAAFLAFVDELRAEFPDLIFENCASGAMRSDLGTLKHFSVQSVSDQEDYLLMPSIVSGSLACIQPEKTGIWSYPYPLLFENKDKAITMVEVASHADGEQTAFNVVTALMGNMYLSGRIDCADEYNLSLIKEGVRLYKENRAFIERATAIYPCGVLGITEKKPYAFGLKYQDRIVLALFNLCDEKCELSIDMRKYGVVRGELLFPMKQADLCVEEGVLTFQFEKGKIARLAELTTKENPAL